MCRGAPFNVASRNARISQGFRRIRLRRPRGGAQTPCNATFLLLATFCSTVRICLSEAVRFELTAREEEDQAHERDYCNYVDFRRRRRRYAGDYRFREYLTHTRRSGDIGVRRS
jgi:hypothetical protein